MGTTRKKALKLWPDTSSEDWSEYGGTLVHKDAKVEVPEKNLIGGYIRSGRVSDNAQVSDNARVYGDARVYGGAQVSDNAQVSGDAWVYGDARVYGGAQVSDNAQVSGDAWVSGCAQVYGGAWVYGDARVSGDARVYGDAQVSGGLWEVSPIYLQGRQHSINVCSPGFLAIGCEIHPFSVWEESFQRIGKDNGYSDSEIKEYEILIKAVIAITKMREEAE